MSGKTREEYIMKVVGINGSPRREGNTSIIIKAVFKELEKNGIETELIQLGGLPIRSCMSCYKCFEKQNGKCIIHNDGFNSQKNLPRHGWYTHLCHGRYSY